MLYLCNMLPNPGCYSISSQQNRKVGAKLHSGTKSVCNSEPLIVNADPVRMPRSDVSRKAPVGKDLVARRAFVHPRLHVNFAHVASHGGLVADAL